MQRDCALRIAGRGRLTSFSMGYETGHPRRTSLLEYRHIIRPHALSQLPYWPLSRHRELLGAPVSSRTIAKRLAEGPLVSRGALRVLPMTPTHRHLHLQRYHARQDWTAVEWNQVVLSDDSRFDLSSNDYRVRVWRPRSKRHNPSIPL
ncbi:transposable element Tcb2 transposase [Trichonephila clavipes]|nr:transposable element Tcb2 transposase [Trichonephila clavipes]